MRRRKLKPFVTMIGLGAIVLAAALALRQSGATDAHAPPGAAPVSASSAAGTEAAAGDRKVLYWWDPMLGPSSIRDHPGKSAMGMDLVPVYGQEAPGGGGSLTIDPRIVQEMGVRTAPVVRGPLHKTLRLVGIFKVPEPGLHDVSLKVGGWIDRLYANQEGMHVHKGEPLLALYSPELQVAEQELIGAVESRRALPAGTGAALQKEGDAMIASARRKLELWDVDPREIDAIAHADRPPRDIVFRSPATGHVEEKAVVQGSAVQPGMKLMRIADHSTLWLEAQAYEQQVPMVKLGQAVNVTLDALPGRTFTGTINFIYPHLDHMTRTLVLRATFANPKFELRPGMYADANIVTEPSADAIQVPQESVIDTGTGQLVFVSQGGGHFAPRIVRTGIRGDRDTIQIVEGLSVGETVVTSGQFLMDVESRTQEAIAKLRGGNGAPPAPKPTESETMPMTVPSQPATVPSSTQAAMPPTQPSAVTAAAVALVYCPMVKVQWVQRPGLIDNPFLGPQMQTCGQVQSQLPVPASGSRLAPVLEAYLAMQQQLGAGRYDAKAAEQLKIAADRLRGVGDAALRAAVDQFAAAPRLKDAQATFQQVSQALIPLLKQAAAAPH